MKKVLLLASLLLTAWQLRATVFGTPQAIRCPACKQVTMKEFPLLSGNTIGAICWSDSKRYAPMLPEVPLLVKCPVCGAFLLPAENYYLGEVAQEVLDRAVNTSACELNFSEYLAAMELIADRRTACLLAVYSYNDLYRWQRTEEAEEAAARAAFVKLADELCTLLDASDAGDYVLRAELYRETGRFDKCIAQLEAREPGDEMLDAIAAQILEHARSGNMQVFPLKE